MKDEHSGISSDSMWYISIGKTNVIFPFTYDYVKYNLLSSRVSPLTHLYPLFLFIAAFINDDDNDISNNSNYSDLELKLTLIFLIMIHFFPLNPLLNTTLGRL